MKIKRLLTIPFIAILSATALANNHLNMPLTDFPNSKPKWKVYFDGMDNTTHTYDANNIKRIGGYNGILIIDTKSTNPLNTNTFYGRSLISCNHQSISPFFLLEKTTDIHGKVNAFNQYGLDESIDSMIPVSPRHLKHRNLLNAICSEVDA